MKKQLAVHLVPNDNSSPRNVSVWKHCITNELSLWQDVFSVDKNWYGFDIVITDLNAIIERNSVYLDTRVFFANSDADAGAANCSPMKRGKVFAASSKLIEFESVPMMSPSSISDIIMYYNTNGALPEPASAELLFGGVMHIRIHADDTPLYSDNDINELIAAMCKYSGMIHPELFEPVRKDWSAKVFAAAYNA